MRGVLVVSNSEISEPRKPMRGIAKMVKSGFVEMSQLTKFPYLKPCDLYCPWEHSGGIKSSPNRGKILDF
jgi:hypothetical protein